MKKLTLALIAVCLIASLAFAAGETAATSTPAAAATVMLKGTVIDNQCAGANSSNLGEFIKTHEKSCALMPACAATGYSIYADGKLTKFDNESSVKVEEFLKNPESKLDVVIEATKAGDELKLVSIKNQ